MADSVPGKLNSDEGGSNGQNSNTNKDAGSELYCEPCKDDGKHEKAHGFCVDCQNYLCDSCFKYHCIPKPSKHHHLLGTAEMPKRKVDCGFSELCTINDRAETKYFCKTHLESGCKMCMDKDHKSCEICELAEASKNVEQSTMASNFDSWLTTIEKDLIQQIDLAINNVSESERCSKEAILHIEQFHNQILDKFEKLKHKIVTDINLRREQDLKRIYAIDKSVESARVKVVEMKSDFEILRTTKQRKQLYITLLKHQQQQSDLSNVLEQAQKGNTVQKYRFVEDKLLVDYLKYANELGNIRKFSDNSMN